VPQAAAAGPTVSTALLMPQHDRIARRPLDPWAAELSRRLDAIERERRDVRNYCGDVSRVANNAALVATLAGEASTARRLCDGQIRWQGRYARRSHDGAVAAYGLQPWINLGRLDAASGASDAALARFATLRETAGGPALMLGTCRLERAHWVVVSRTADAFDRLLTAVYVLDSLRALLIARRYADAEAFGTGMGLGATDPLAVYADEAAIVGAGATGAYDRACCRAAAMQLTTRGWERAVFQLRLAEARACAGGLGPARELLAPLASVLGKLSRATQFTLQTLHVLVRVSALCRDLDLLDAAALLGTRAYEGAGEADDEVLRIEALRILVAVDAAERRTQRAAELDQLECETHYARYRRDRSAGDGLGPAGRALTDRLLEMFATRADTPVSRAPRRHARRSVVPVA
jgi:hypothetical protein